MKVLEMAEAHLQTVAKAIVDLNNQKNAIEQEINKLNEYLQLGREEVNKARSNVVNVVE
jgi:predicted  nucleic acid-binding Zn-ribbon protein